LFAPLGGGGAGSGKRERRSLRVSLECEIFGGDFLQGLSGGRWALEHGQAGAACACSLTWAGNLRQWRPLANTWPPNHVAYRILPDFLELPESIPAPALKLEPDPFGDRFSSCRATNYRTGAASRAILTLRLDDASAAMTHPSHHGHCPLPLPMNRPPRARLRGPGKAA